jgi:ribosomal protein S18 acetylase RimI-like enzyme
MYQGMEYKVNIREMQKADIPQAAEVLGKAYATTPPILAVYGDSTAALRFQNIIKGGFKSPKGRCFVAELDDRIVGGMRILKSPDCYAFSFKLIPSVLSATRGLGPLIRLMKMIGAWRRKHDTKQLHWHLQFLGVAPDFQGKGIGSKMMVFYCDIVDRDMIEAYHETATPENVPFYERFGFKVVGEETINGVKNWYMLRPAKSTK